MVRAHGIMVIALPSMTNANLWWLVVVLVWCLSWTKCLSCLIARCLDVSTLVSVPMWAAVAWVLFGLL